ncbi:hypothetical protein SCHPADRAFT_1001026 [Schizopora paradoxa]|uniref:DUF6533 domain-containing protein n=1 Tax=Schizopora paradoxa TaxID=27342 RepID=A0A0H2RA93_9AGAM|nr:hypothetical protein SCHPADRAFT_1001026 [Schizopora paradoxa]
MTFELAPSMRLVAQGVDVKYSFLVAVVILFHDTVILFEDEVNFIWSKRWTIGKVLYIVIRYLAFVDASLILFYSFASAHSPEACDLLYNVTMWFMTAGTIFGQVVLLVRTYAIWDQRRTVGICLVLFHCGTIIAGAFFLNDSAAALKFVPSPAPGVVPCIPLPNRSSAGAFLDPLSWGKNIRYLTSTTFENIERKLTDILLLTLIKARMQWTKHATPIMHTLYRDGILYCVILLLVSLANVILMRSVNDAPYFYMLTEPLRVLHAVFTTRIILNVRMAAEKPVADFDKSCFGDIPTFEVHSSVGSLDHRISDVDLTDD